MGTNWDLWCRTCNDQTDLGMSHVADDLQQFVAGDGVAKAAGLYALSPGEFIVEFWGHAISGWCARHVGHDVVVRSEYGDVYGACAKSYKCATCGHSKHCKRPADHEGACSDSVV